MIIVQYSEVSGALSVAEDNEQRVKDVLNSIESFNEAHDDIEARKEKELEKIDLTYSLYNGKLNTAIILDDLAKVFPTDYGYLKRLQKNQNQYVLNGIIQKEEQFHKFLDNLSKTQTLSAYNVKEIKKVNEGIDFRIEIFEKIQ